MGVLLIAVMSGSLLTYAYDQDAALAERLCMGACTGITSVSLLGFLLASSFGSLNLFSVLLATALSAVVAALPLSQMAYRARIRTDIYQAVSGVRQSLLHPGRIAVLKFAVYICLVVVLWLVFRRVMFERSGEIYTGIVHNVGDLPFHIQAIASFVYGRNFPPEHPSYAGSRFVYPFLADFATAMWVRAGASLTNAMFAQNLVLALSFVGLMSRFTRQLTRSRTAA